MPECHIDDSLGWPEIHLLGLTAPQVLKRAVDVLGACAFGIALLPAFAILWLLVPATSRGRRLYGHPRVGRGGEIFTAWKFRTMVEDADEVLERHLAADAALRDEWQLAQKLRRDPRVTWIGRILRRTSMDELPQLWNVVRGDMSLVGPRPIIESEIARYGPQYSLYQRMRPGLTGLWQISGRNRLRYDERVRMDEHYVRNWTLWLDLYILRRTVKVVLTGEGAY